MISTVAALILALQTPHSGETLVLAPGSYSLVSIRNVHGPVTISSGDSVHRAQLEGLTVVNSSEITFLNIDMLASSSSTPLQPLRVLSSDHISLDNVKVYGRSSDFPAETHGLFFGNDNNILVKHSEFSALRVAVTVKDSENITFSSNIFHDIRTDGIDSGGTANENIDGNDFRDFRPQESDHPDCIQFWPTPDHPLVKNISIINNTYERGHGGIVHGIFIRPKPGAPISFEGVRISGNRLLGIGVRSITLRLGRNVTLTDNVAQAWPDRSPSTIRLWDSESVIATGNQAGMYDFRGLTNVVASHNSVIPTAPAHPD